MSTASRIGNTLCRWRSTDNDRPSIDATLTRRPTLAEHLIGQIRMAGLTEDECGAAQYIVGNLDDRGFLRSSIEEIVRETIMH